MIRDVLQRLEQAASSRPKFDTPPTVEQARKAVRLSRGPAPQPLVAFPAPLALCGPQQYARFARGFRSLRDLLVVTIPGFVGSESLPATLEVAIDDQAAGIERAARGRPAVLMGYSTGGTFAYGMAGHLERVGVPVAAVVLLDAYPSGHDAQLTPQLDALVAKLFNEPAWRGYLNDTRLTAMGWYARLVMDWAVEPVDAPTLMVQSSEPMPGVSDDGTWKAVWPHAHDVLEVRGDHYTMLEDHAETTAEAVERWLSKTLPREQ